MAQAPYSDSHGYSVSSYRKRVEELLGKLADRSKKTPGLYPVKSEKAFFEIAADSAFDKQELSYQEVTQLNIQQLESLAGCLEHLWHHPDHSPHLYGQSQIRRGASTPFSTSLQSPNSGKLRAPG